jgi:hypothetical protein
MLAVASAAIGTGPGCAFIFSQGPPSPERQAKETYFDCSGSWAPPIVDTLLATGTGISAVATYNSQTVAYPHNAAAISAGLTALLATSAIYGVTSVASCGSAKRARLERKERETLLPVPYGTPPWGQPPPYWPPPVAFNRPAAPAPKRPEPESPTLTPTPTMPETPTEPSAKPAPAAPIFKPAPPAF